MRTTTRVSLGLIFGLVELSIVLGAGCASSSGGTGTGGTGGANGSGGVSGGTGGATSGTCSPTCAADQDCIGGSCMPFYGKTCTTANDCPVNALCCDGATKTCDGTPLPSGDGTNSGEFTVSADGLTVTDTITGLAWQRDGSGTRAACITDSSNFACTWAEAKTYCAGLALGGLSLWRLPTRHELRTIVDFTRDNPSIDPTAFPNTPSEDFWTSSPHGGPSGTWYVNFFVGSSDSGYVGDFRRVRCVR